MSDFSELETELANIEQWQRENADKLGTLEYRKKTLTHRLLTQIISGKAKPEEVYRVLRSIEDGTHPLLSDTATKGTG